MNDTKNQDSSGIDGYHSHKLLFEKRIWTIDDVVLFTGLSKGTVYNKSATGEIPKKKRAGRLYFDPDEIHDWILGGYQ